MVPAGDMVTVEAEKLIILKGRGPHTRAAPPAPEARLRGVEGGALHAADVPVGGAVRPARPGRLRVGLS